MNETQLTSHEIELDEITTSLDGLHQSAITINEQLGTSRHHELCVSIDQSQDNMKMMKRKVAQVKHAHGHCICIILLLVLIAIIFMCILFT